jgi:hypothetical protein
MATIAARSRGVTMMNTATHRPTRSTIVDAARDLLAGDRVAVDISDLDVETALLDCATTVLSQLGVLDHMCRNRDHHSRLVMGIVDLAESYEVCSPGAIGVSGVLVDQLRSPDELALACSLTVAYRSFDTDELATGSAALLAAATTFLADALGADPMAVHDELHDRASTTRRIRCRRRDGSQ